jgi:hypothetical protein
MRKAREQESGISAQFAPDRTSLASRYLPTPALAHGTGNECIHKLYIDSRNKYHNN